MGKSKYAVEPPYEDMSDEDLLKFVKNQQKYMSSLRLSYEAARQAGERKNPGIAEYAKNALEAYSVIRTKNIPKLSEREKIIAIIKRNVAFVKTYDTPFSSRAKEIGKTASLLSKQIEKLENRKASIRGLIGGFVNSNSNIVDILNIASGDLYDTKLLTEKKEYEVKGENFIMASYLMKMLKSKKETAKEAGSIFSELLDKNEGDTSKALSDLIAKYPSFQSMQEYNEKEDIKEKMERNREQIESAQEAITKKYGVKFKKF